MRERRSEIRMLCADMVEVSWSNPKGQTRRGTALLEDICTSGACIQTDLPIAPGTDVRICCDGKTLDGIVRYCVYREIGYFAGVEFAAGCEWSRQEFEPEHLLDLETLMRRSERKTGH